MRSDIPHLATNEDMRRIGDVPLSERYSWTHTYQVLQDAARRSPNKVGVSFQLKGDPKGKAFSWTYAQYLAEVTRAANLFKQLGASPERPVALLTPNLPEAVFAKFAAEAAGAVCMVNPLMEPEQIAAILRDSRASILVSLAPFPKTDIADRAAAALALAPDVKHLIEIDMKRYVGAPLSWIIPLVRPKRSAARHGAKVQDYAAAVANFSADTLTFALEGCHERIGAYFHTGGTTGDPKLAIHSQGSMLFMGWIADHCVTGRGETLLCAVPLFHVFGAYVLALATAVGGGHLVLLTPAGYRGEGVIDNFWKLVERWKANFFVSVPTAISALNQRPVGDADISSLQYTICGSAALATALFESFEAQTGIKILEGFGQTEATCVCSANPPDGERRIGSVGFPLAYTEMRVGKFDATDTLVGYCGTDEIGEILVRGASVFAGYTDESRNKSVFAESPDGGGRWLRTGDLGRIDAEKYFWITGRAKDLIIRGGHNIDPGVIEEALMKHPAVAFAGAIGQPDPHAGELPCAYVELKEGADATTEDLRNFAAAHCPERAAAPVYVEILDELPKTVVGKIFKPALRARAMERVFAEAVAGAGGCCAVTIEKDAVHGLAVVLTPDAGAKRDALAGAMAKFASHWRFAEDA